MRKSLLKNVAIVGLVLLSFVLVIQLWYGESVGRQLSWLFSPTGAMPDSFSMSAFLRPYRVIVKSEENDDFYIRYNQYQSWDVKTEADHILLQMLKQGELKKTGRVEYDSMFAGTIVAFSYPFGMPAESFARALGVSGHALTQRIKQFHYVVISIQDDGVYIYFADQENDVMAAFSLHNENIETLADAVYTECEQDHDVWYTRLRDKTQWSGDLFAANWQGSLQYDAVMPLRSYEDNGDIRISAIETKIGFLFENPGAVWADNLDGVFKFTEGNVNGNVVVKYNPDHVLEYVNYRFDEKKSEDTLLSAFSAAVRLIALDETMTNEYYLSGYKIEAGDTYTFYFDWLINNFPITFSPNFRNKIDLNSAIEVSVSAGIVSKYKRYAYDFQMEDGDKMAATKEFETAFAEGYGTLDTDTQMKRVDLAYSIDANSVETTLRLSWFFGSEDGEREWANVVLAAQ